DALLALQMDVRQGAHRVGCVLGRHQEPARTQFAGEGDDSFDEIHTVSRPDSSSALTLRRSASSLTRHPSVDSTISAESCEACNATSAFAQSSVSETPGTLASFAPRSCCTTATMRVASSSLAPGTFRRTMASSFANGG